VLRPRTKEAIAAGRGAGLHVIVVTGRMFQSVRRYLEAAGLDDPVVCYQGAVVADPVSGRFLRHVPIPLELAREAIAALEVEGWPINCYVDDELYVARVTWHAEQYARFQNIELHEVGDLLAWLDRPPTKLVVVGDPDELDELSAVLRPQFEQRLFIAKSLPIFLEFANPGVSKGVGLQVVADLLGFTAASTVAFGDGENDRELLEWAAYAIAVENGDDSVKALADFICPAADHEGVAQVVEAFLAR